MKNLRKASLGKQLGIGKGLPFHLVKSQDVKVAKLNCIGNILLGYVKRDVSAKLRFIGFATRVLNKITRTVHARERRMVQYSTPAF